MKFKLPVTARVSAYMRRNPFQINWGENFGDPITKKESTWDAFYAAGAIDIPPHDLSGGKGVSLIAGPDADLNALPIG